MPLDFSTPPSSPLGSPKRVRPLFFGNEENAENIQPNFVSPPSPPKRVRKASPVWLESTKNAMPSTPEMFVGITPVRVVGNGHYSQCTLFNTPEGREVVKRDFRVGFSDRLVVPRDFRSQAKAFEIVREKKLNHCLSPIAAEIKESDDGTLLEVSQLFPAGTPLRDFAIEHPEMVENLSNKWITAVLETNRDSGMVYCDPKPDNAVVMPDGSVKLIDIDFKSIDEFEEEACDYISGRYYASVDSPYETALYLGVCDLKTGFRLSKDQLIQIGENVNENDLKPFRSY